jgi:hypothetical protein
MQWVLWFLSGIGFAGIGNPLNGTDTDGIWAWVDNYCRDHPRALRRHDPPKLRQREARPVPVYQRGGVKPAAAVAAVAGHSQGGEAGGDLAERYDA